MSTIHMSTKTLRFVEQARIVHGDKYSYDKVEFVNVHTPVIITCPIHGDFPQRPVKHTSQKCGCPRCGRIIINNSRRSSTDGFICKARVVHGDRYNYSLAKYINNHTPIKIICPTHGMFEQLPVKHTSQKCGCPRCALTTTLEDFVSKSEQIHNYKYDYTKTEYQRSHIHVTVVCPKHGEFLTTPNNHLQGYGCWSCGTENHGGMYRESTLSGTELGSVPGLLYFVKLTHEETMDTFYKIGITKHTVARRLSSGQHSTEVLATVPGTLYEVFNLEQRLLLDYREYQYLPKSMFGNGSTECFRFSDDVRDQIMHILLDFGKCPT